jgi:hypothetical protein
LRKISEKTRKIRKSLTWVILSDAEKRKEKNITRAAKDERESKKKEER